MLFAEALDDFNLAFEAVVASIPIVFQRHVSVNMDILEDGQGFVESSFIVHNPILTVILVTVNLNLRIF